MSFDDGTDIESDGAAGQVELMEMDVESVVTGEVIFMRMTGEWGSRVAESGADAGSMTMEP